jgi:ABC-type uncharacterized transport system substrate-binding protein
LAGLIVCSIAAQAQQKPSSYRIGFLRNGPVPEMFIDGFRQGLQEIGYAEGKDFAIEYGLAETADQLPAAAADLVQRKVAVIIASGTPPVPAAKDATSTIPIVFVASIDPVATGVAASLAHPGGNVTGFTLASADLMGKRLELLKEIVPNLSRVAVLSQAKNPGNLEYLRQSELAAPALALQLQFVAVNEPTDFEQAFTELRGAQAVIQMENVLFTSYRKQIVQMALTQRVPVVYGFREFVDEGGLVAYGADLRDQYRRAATYVDKILKGAKPGDLPVQQPTKLELVINIKTARALGLEIPPTILSRANEVIE